jgi:hypothetical protein
MAVWKVAIKDYPLKVSIRHGHLKPEERIEEVADRKETLIVGAMVEYRADGDPVDPTSLSGFWNYASTVVYLNGLQQTVLDTVLEAVAAKIGDHLRRYLSENPIDVISFTVRIRRPDLLPPMVVSIERTAAA